MKPSALDYFRRCRANQRYLSNRRCRGADGDGRRDGQIVQNEGCNMDRGFHDGSNGLERKSPRPDGASVVFLIALGRGTLIQNDRAPRMGYRRLDTLALEPSYSN